MRPPVSRSKRVLKRLGWTVVALAALWFAPDAAGYVQGRLEATHDLAAGRAELRTLGLLRDPRGSFDPQTGLFYHSLG